MSLDFVAIKWQQIRQAENFQLIENENIKLRKQIEVLTLENDSIKNAKKGVEVDILDKFQERVQRTVNSVTKDLEELKGNTRSHLNHLYFERENLKFAFDKLIVILKEKDLSISELKDSQKVLKSKFEDSEKQLSNWQRKSFDGSISHNNEISKLSARYDVLSREYNELKSSSSAVQKSNEDLCKSLEEMSVERTKSEARSKVCAFSLFDSTACHYLINKFLEK